MSAMQLQTEIAKIVDRCIDNEEIAAEIAEEIVTLLIYGYRIKL